MITTAPGVSNVRESVSEVIASPGASEVGPRPAAGCLSGKHVGMVVFSSYPADPRPRRAVDALLQAGATIDLIAEDTDGLPRRERLSSGLDVTRIPIQHHRGGALSYAYEYSLFIFWAAAIFGWRTLWRRYQLIYVHNMPDVLVASAGIPRLLGAKVILDQHDPMPELMMTIFGSGEKSFAVRTLRFLERWSFRRADRIVTVNEACRKLFCSRSASADKLAVVMNAPDETVFPCRPAGARSARREDHPFVMMYHGSLVERNGLELAVDALAQVAERVPRAELRIYGKASPYLDGVMNKVKRLYLDTRVRYLGPKTLEELVHEIDSCDVGIIPNLKNVFTDINTPTRIFEYLALGKPVIAPRTPGIQDYFAPESLYFFNSGDPTELAAQIEHVYLHPGEALATATRGQHVYLGHAWSQEKQILLGVVARLLEEERVC